MNLSAPAPHPGAPSIARPRTDQTGITTMLVAGGAATLVGSITGGIAGTKLAEARGIRSAPIALSIAGGLAAGAATRHLLAGDAADGASATTRTVAGDAGGAVLGGAAAALAAASAVKVVEASLRGGCHPIGIGVGRAAPIAIGAGAVLGAIGGGLAAHAALD